MRDYEQAARLDPANADYALAARVARSHAVTALIQTAAKARLRGDRPAARAALPHGLGTGPRNAQVAEHLYELGDDALRGQSKPLYEEGAQTFGEGPDAGARCRVHSFHLRTDQRQTDPDRSSRPTGLKPPWTRACRSAQSGWTWTTSGSKQATRILNMVTKSFYVPLDAHRVLVAKDTKNNRQQLYAPGDGDDLSVRADRRRR